MKSACDDIIKGALNWRVWMLMGGNNLRQRYSRSALGQWWIVIGTMITNTAFGLLWSQLWNQPIAVFLPYVAIGHICWALITGPMMDGITALQSSSYYYTNQNAPYSTVFFANYFRSILMFAHNLVLIPILWVIFKMPITWSLALLIPAILLVGIITINISIVIGLISCRYRDVGQVMGNILQVMYMVTPVMWMTTFLNRVAEWVVMLNPFAQMLFLLREPLLGNTPTLYSWLCCIGLAVVSSIIVVLSLRLAGRKVVFWL